MAENTHNQLPKNLRTTSELQVIKQHRTIISKSFSKKVELPAAEGLMVPWRATGSGRERSYAVPEICEARAMEGRRRTERTEGA